MSKKRTRSVKKRSTFKSSNTKGTHGGTSVKRRFNRILLGLRSSMPSSTKLGAGASSNAAVQRKGMYSISHKGELRQERELDRLEKKPSLNKAQKARLKYLKEKKEIT